MQKIIALFILTPILSFASENHTLSNDLKTLMQSKPEIKQYLQESIVKAKEENPDKNYNPVQSLDAFLNYADEFAHTLPGALPPGNLFHQKGTVTRESIHQNIMYFYFLINQPIKALENKGLFKNTLQFYPPFNDWLIALTKEKGEFLNSPQSWSQSDFEKYRQSKSFNFDKNWYGQKNIWHTYNEFFSRDVTPRSRPIQALNDAHKIISPADSVPQGVWPINQKNQIDIQQGLKVKYLTYYSIDQLLKGSHFASSFKKGFLTHIYLNVYDFHRYFAPVSGKVIEKNIITENMSLDVRWNNANKHYEVIPLTGWQFSETRGYLILKTPQYGLVAIMPIGMEQVSSIRFYPNTHIGNEIQKGDQIGDFLFGASDIIMLFQEQSHFKIMAPKDKDGKYLHLLAGELYGEI